MSIETESGAYIFKHGRKIFIATIVGSYWAENYKPTENGRLFLVAGDDPELTAWGKIEGYRCINNSYLVGKATSLIKALL